MNTLPTRDRWLAAALPALLILLSGWLFTIRPAAKEVSLLERRVENQGTLQTRLDMVSNARAGQAELEKNLARLRETLPPPGSVFNRNIAMQQISQLCETHRLSLSETKLELGDGKLPASLKTAETSLIKSASGPPPQVWRIELVGSYSNVMKLLDGLQHTQALIVPLKVFMQADKNERQPTTWAMTLWL
jgi:hypothetical protein